MLKCDFIVTFMWIALRQGCCPASLLHILRKRFPKNTYGRLLLVILFSTYRQLSVIKNPKKFGYWIKNKGHFRLSVFKINSKMKLVKKCTADHTIGFPAGSYLFKVNNWNTRRTCEICLKLAIKTAEWRQWRCSGVFIVNFEHISYLVIVFLLLTLNR